MTAYSFILSNEGRDRLKRHLFLWAFFCIYFFVVSFNGTAGMTRGNQLEFHLGNGKPAGPPFQTNRRSIDLFNGRKRLQLLHLAQHSSAISSTDDAYNVHLVLTLQEEVTEKIQHWSLTKTVAYA
ncbi:MAG: hypothetical protein ACXVBZ_03060 [Flavisolibacter sp.]